MKPKQYLFISPSFAETRVAEQYEHHESLADTVSSFKSSVWIQGWNADEKVMRLYGDWLIYEIQPPPRPLEYRGKISDF